MTRSVMAYRNTYNLQKDVEGGGARTVAQVGRPYRTQAMADTAAERVVRATQFYRVSCKRVEVEEHHVLTC